jgi:GTPase SAR1 family protein
MEDKNSNEFNVYDFNFEAVKQSENNIVLFGNVGAGKTTLINLLCGTNYTTTQGGFSCTRLVQASPTIRNNNMILDFPGLNSMREIIQHLTQQRETLKIIPVRMICFVVKYNECRYEDILKSIIQMVKIFKHHKENVGIIITHSEKANITTKAEIETIIEEETKINAKNVMFCSLQTSENILSDQLNNIKQKMQNIKETIIESSEIIKQFDTGVSFKFEEIAQEFLDQFKLMVRLHKEEFDKADKELKRCLYFSLKYQKDKIVEDFKNKLLKDGFDTHQVVSQVILLQNSFYHDFKNFKALAEVSLEIQSVVYNGEMNKYKKCIHCGLIWFRVYGCNSIICGRRSVSKDHLFGKFLNYTINFFKGILSISRNEINREGTYTEREVTGLTEEEKKLNLSRNVPIKPEGCGKEMDWDKMEDVTEKVLNEHLKKIEDTDYFANLDNFKFGK